MARWTPLLLVLAAPFAHGGDEPTLEEALRRLPALERVEGSAVGYAGTPGDFYRLSRVLVREGDSALFAKLAGDGRPVTRAMGLYCLALTDERRAVPLLRRHLADTGRFEFGPGGCIYWTASVGEFAYRLLRNRRGLDMGEAAEPLVPDKVPLDVGILARDACSDVHGVASRSLAGSPPAFDLAGLRQACPDLEAWQIVKAVGRLDPRPDSRRFLIGCLRDGELDEAARNAAASALTRDPDDRALAALEASAGTRFVAAAELGRRHAALMAKVRAEKTWQGMEAIKPTVIEAFTIDHPLGLDALDAAFSLAITRQEDVRRVVVKSLLRIAGRHREFREPWDTFGDLSRRVERIVESRQELLRPDEAAAIRARLRE